VSGIDTIKARNETMTHHAPAVTSAEETTTAPDGALKDADLGAIVGGTADSDSSSVPAAVQQINAYDQWLSSLETQQLPVCAF
jgi:hypothetical protein